MGKLNYQFMGGNRGYITLAIFILGLVVGRIHHFQYGPLEWLWRSLTYLNLQPFLKK